MGVLSHAGSRVCCFLVFPTLVTARLAETPSAISIALPFPVTKSENDGPEFSRSSKAVEEAVEVGCPVGFWDKRELSVDVVAYVREGRILNPM